VRGVVTRIQAHRDGSADVEISTSGWLEMGTYKADYVAPKAMASGTFSVLDYANGADGNWLFTGTFRKDTT
jgi:hypothetical protein